VQRGELELTFLVQICIWHCGMKAYIISNTIIFIYYSKWVVQNGIIGETCTNFYGNDSQLWCANPNIPDCADRTINCTIPPTPEGASISITNNGDPNNIREYLTTLNFTCPLNYYAFDYPVGSKFTSYYFTNNINTTVATCNKDG